MRILRGMYAQLILPIEYKTKDEMMQLKRKIIKMGKDGLIKHFLKLGWSKGSAEILAESFLKDANEK